MVPQKHTECSVRSETLTIPELEQSKAAVLNTLASVHSRADESAESGWLTPELAIGIRRVQGVKRLGRKSGNWLTRNQAQQLLDPASKTNLRGWRDGAIVGLLLGYLEPARGFWLADCVTTPYQNGPRNKLDLGSYFYTCTNMNRGYRGA